MDIEFRNILNQRGLWICDVYIINQNTELFYKTIVENSEKINESSIAALKLQIIEETNG